MNITRSPKLNTYHIWLVYSWLETTDTAFGLPCLCPTRMRCRKHVGHGCMCVPAVCFFILFFKNNRYVQPMPKKRKRKKRNALYLSCQSSHLTLANPALRFISLSQFSPFALFPCFVYVNRFLVLFASYWYTWRAHLLLVTHANKRDVKR